MCKGTPIALLVPGRDKRLLLNKEVTPWQIALTGKPMAHAHIPATVTAVQQSKSINFFLNPTRMTRWESFSMLPKNKFRCYWGHYRKSRFHNSWGYYRLRNGPAFFMSWVVIAADMSDSVKKKILSHCPLFFRGFSFHIRGSSDWKDLLYIYSRESGLTWWQLDFWQISPQAVPRKNTISANSLKI